MTDVVAGRPIQAGSRQLVPLVQVEANVRRGAFVGSGRTASQGRASVRLRPIAILEQRGAHQRRIPIHDRTKQVLGGLMLAALLIPALLALAVRLARRR